jgi:hypothetical protein
MKHVAPHDLSGAPVVVTMTGPVPTDMRKIELARPMTIAEAIAECDLKFRLPTIAVMCGRDVEAAPVLRGQWHVRVVRHGETLAFVSVPGRGGLGGGSGKRIVGLVAAIGLAIAAPYAAGLIFGAGTFMASVASVAFIAGGSLALNVLFPPPQVPVSQAKESVSGETVYSVSASGNRAMPLEPVPVVYGRVRYPPPYASRPYAEFVGNDQYLYQLHCFTCGEAVISKLEIGDTVAWQQGIGASDAFAGLEIQVAPPGTDITLFPINVSVSDAVSGQVLPSPPDTLGPYVVNPTNTTVTAIAIDLVFPSGLFGLDDQGKPRDASRHVKAEYRPVDNSGIGIGSFVTLFEKTYQNRTKTPLRFSERVDVAAGRYEVKLSSTTPDLTDNNSDSVTVNRVLWAGLRGYLSGFPTPQGVTLIATKIKASEQLSQSSAGQYFFTGTRVLRGRADGEWTEKASTRSIAWAAADLLTDSDYGLGIADADVDLDWLEAYHDIWAGRGDNFDAVFDRKWVAMQAINAVLSCGRSSVVRLGGRIGFVRDEPKQVRRAVFTPRNIVRGSIKRKDIWFDEETPDHTIARYIDAEVWSERTVDCIISSVGDAEPVEREMFGISDRSHAWREGIYRTADNAYRRSFRSFTVESEGKLLVRGDPILLHDPLYDALTRIAALESFDPSVSTPVITVDRDLDPGSEAEYHVIIRDRLGREWGPCLVHSFPTERQIRLDAADRFIVEAAHGELEGLIPGGRSEPAHVSLLIGAGTRLWDGLVVGARPNGKFVDVVCVNDDQRVHSADETETTPAPYTPPDIFAPIPDAPVITGLYAKAERVTMGVELQAGWQPSPGAQRYIAEISYDENADSAPNAASWTPVHDSVGTRLAVSIESQDVTLRVAAIGQRPGPWTYAFVSDVPLPELPPQIVNDRALDLALRAQIQQFQEQIFQRSEDFQQQIAQVSQALNNQVSGIIESLGQIRIGVGQRYGQNAAAVQQAMVAIADADEAFALFKQTVEAAFGTDIEAYVETVEAAFTSANEAIAQLEQTVAAELSGQINSTINELQVTVATVENSLALLQTYAESNYDDLSAKGLFRITTGAAPGGASSRIELQARASSSDTFAQAGIVIDAGVTALGGKSQVQIYAQKAVGDPVPVFTVADNAVRLDGSVLFPRDVLGAAKEQGGVVARSGITYSGGVYDSGWIDAVEVDAIVDATTDCVDLSMQVGNVDFSFSAAMTASIRLLRNGTQIHPPSAFSNGIPIFGTSGALATSVYSIAPYDFVDLPPSSGTYTYKWQVRMRVASGGSGSGDNFSFAGLFVRAIYPKNQIQA